MILMKTELIHSPFLITTDFNYKRPPNCFCQGVGCSLTRSWEENSCTHGLRTNMLKDNRNTLKEM